MRAILIVAYRRSLALAEILNSAHSSGIKNIYIHIDGPKDLLAVSDVEKVTLVARRFAKEENLNVRISSQTENLGCAVSLIKSLDSVLAEVDELVVLEDDCIPGADFWKFSEQSFKVMESDSSIALFCGPQFAPKHILSTDWFLSAYPFHWGWGTNSVRWREIRQGILSPVDLTASQGNSVYESRYWNAGCRRALSGFTDVWDTLFVRQMHHMGMKALLPPQNLVRNLGNDDVALHTSDESIWTNYKIGNYQTQSKKPELNTNFDDWARRNYFKISRRHLLSTRFTFLLDKFRKKRFQKSLFERIEAASVNFF